MFRSFYLLRAQASIGYVHNVVLFCELLAAGWVVIPFVLASMLFKQRRVGTRKDNRVPAMIVLFAIVNICSGEYKS